MTLVEYSLDEDGRMTVHNDTARCYAYIDMTPQAEALFWFIEHTINTELAEELSFLAAYDIRSPIAKGLRVQSRCPPLSLASVFNDCLCAGPGHVCKHPEDAESFADILCHAFSLHV